jgi:hypothetical protein
MREKRPGHRLCDGPLQGLQRCIRDCSHEAAGWNAFGKETAKLLQQEVQLLFMTYTKDEASWELATHLRSNHGAQMTDGLFVAALWEHPTSAGYVYLQSDELGMLVLADK